MPINSSTLTASISASIPCTTPTFGASRSTGTAAVPGAADQSPPRRPTHVLPPRKSGLAQVIDDAPTASRPSARRMIGTPSRSRSRSQRHPAVQWLYPQRGGAARPTGAGADPVGGSLAIIAAAALRCVKAGAAGAAYPSRRHGSWAVPMTIGFATAGGCRGAISPCAPWSSIGPVQGCAARRSRTKARAWAGAAAGACLRRVPNRSACGGRRTAGTEAAADPRP